MATLIEITPSIEDVAREVDCVNNLWAEGEIDIRLQVYPDGEWALHYGGAGYDTDHRGYWGSSSVPGNGKPIKAREIASDLIDQMQEQAAQDGVE